MMPIYVHGLPGSGAELAIGGVSGTEMDRDVQDGGVAPGPAVLHCAVLDRDAPSFAQLAIRLPNAPVHLIGFSFGAACALRLAALAPEKVRRLTLVSATAPLELGDFLPHMAGASLLRLAKSAGRLRAMTTVQSALARVSPGLVLKLVARRADAADAALLDDATCLSVLKTAVSEGLTKGRGAYLREMAAYTQPWARHLPRVSCPVTLHHGAMDAWAPLDMAYALQQNLPRAELITYDDLGHYSTLRRALPQILSS